MLEPSDTRAGLAGRTAVVTAATYGLGLDVASRLCDAGARVGIPVEPDDVDADRARTVLSGRPGRAVLVPAGALADVAARLGRLDILVHLAAAPDPLPRAELLVTSMALGGRVVVVSGEPSPVPDLAAALAPRRIAVDGIVTGAGHRRFAGIAAAVASLCTEAYADRPNRMSGGPRRAATA